ncbi:MAG: glycoside hydrolase family 27 protein [Clostridiales bacterium]|nr:glycoside hydrolase family 27 protein [Clostridiales bacterium]
MIVKKPPMGWNTWNTFGEKINEQIVKESTDAFVELGLKDYGYEYIVIDDCWSERTRDAVTDRIVADHIKFPNGMKAVGDYIHSKGLKFGMYSCTGVRTCADYPGSFDHEYLDAETFAEWGVDFLKYDNCYKPKTADCQLLYHRMGIALENCGRDILYSACNWGTEDVWTWIRSTGAHMYRSTGDIFDSFQSYKDIAMSQVNKFGYSAENCYNDIDMLTVGMNGSGNVGRGGCTDAEYRQQFVLWCMYCAPLMLGCDIRSISAESKALVTNRELIAIDQDEANRPPIWQHHPWNENLKVAFKHLANGEYAIAFYNFSDNDAGIPAMFELFGIPSNSGYKLALTDVFTGEKIGEFKDYINVKVATHDVKLYKAKLVK